MQKISSREKFVDEVVRSIATSDEKEGAFIFGISGKWGEGKTYFLDSLKDELEKSNISSMKVVQLNPWKFAHADNSIFRELLRQITELHSNWFKRNILKHKLQVLYHDVSKKKINWRATLIATCVFLAAGILYKYPLPFLLSTKTLVSQNKTLFTLLLIPVLLGVANSITTSQSSTKAVSTRDKFDELIKKVLKDLDLDKVVVYVDDLDRLTASKALSVLDNLRTFFDNQKLVFVVASDHTVLERHLGRELRPEAESADQMDEGRRYLKKIFNVYWRLPIPTKPEFEEYVKALIDKKGNPFLHKSLKNPTFRKSFRDYLLTYFSNNFRNVERFVNRVEFTFRLLEAQHTARTTSQRNKEYFAEMLDNPLLVVRVLLIEELANPLFDAMQHKPELLLTLEQKATDGEQAEPSFTNALKDLSTEQTAFMISFLSVKPRFRDETGVKVMSIEPYISLSSDSSFGDIRGLSPKEFSSYLKKDMTTDLTTILSRSSEQKIQEALDNFTEEFAALTDLPIKKKLLSNLVHVAQASDPKLPAQAIITSMLLNSDLSFIDQLEPAEKILVTEELGTLKLTDTELEELISKVPNFSATEWANIASLENGEPISQLTQRKFLRYFKEYFPANQADALTQIGPRISAFNAKTVNTELTTHIEQLINYFIADNNDTRRDYGLALLRKTDAGFPALMDRLKTELSVRNSPIFNWLAGPAKSSSEPLFSMQAMVDSVINGPTPVSSIADLSDRLTLFQSLPEAKDILWEALLKLDYPILIDTLYEAILINNYVPIAPNSDVANNILEIIIRRFITKDAVSKPETIGWLGRITPAHWVFVNLKLNSQLVRLIDTRLGTKYLSDEARQHLERIKSEFSAS
jgi:hypothetical protein